MFANLGVKLIEIF